MLHTKGHFSEFKCTTPAYCMFYYASVWVLELQILGHIIKQTTSVCYSCVFLGNNSISSTENRILSLIWWSMNSPLNLNKICFALPRKLKTILKSFIQYLFNVTVQMSLRAGIRLQVFHHLAEQPKYWARKLFSF